MSRCPSYPILCLFVWLRGEVVLYGAVWWYAHHTYGGLWWYTGVHTCMVIWCKSVLYYNVVMWYCVVVAVICYGSIVYGTGNVLQL